MTICLAPRGWAFPPFSLILSFLLIAPLDIAFGNCLKEIKYRMVETRTHAIEQGVDISSLTTQDLLRGKSEEIHYEVSICIDQLGFVTRSNTRLESSNSFYPNPTYATIYSPTSFSTYKKDGSLISQRMHLAEEIENMPGVAVALSTDQIDAYGLSTNFSAIDADFNYQFSSISNSTFWSSGTKTYYSSPELDVIIAPDQLYYLTSDYDSAGELQKMHVRTFQLRDGYIIPQFDIRHVYDDLSLGKLQTTTQKKYLSYEVYANNQPIMQFVESEYPTLIQSTRQRITEQTSFSRFSVPLRIKPSVSLFPNPTADLLNIKLENSWQELPVRWLIKDASGRIIKHGDKPVGALHFTITMNELIAGQYTISFIHQQRQITRPFIVAK